MSDDSTNTEELVERAKTFIERTEDRLKSAHSVPENTTQTIRRRLNELHHLVEEQDVEAIGDELPELREFVDEALEGKEKSVFREYVESIGMAIVFALFLRAFVFEAFKIPSGSMKPTLKVGDHLFVNKFTYGIRVPFTETFMVRFDKPKRGEIVVFEFPSEEAKQHLARQPASERSCIERGTIKNPKDFIKRVIGVAGDTIKMRENRLYLNGEPVDWSSVRKNPTGKYMHPYVNFARESIGDSQHLIRYRGEEPKFGPITVEPGHIFVMGDNRDNSADSRCWGQVPIENVKGRAMFIWWSPQTDFELWPPTFSRVRWDRIGKGIH